ncbi:YitT family protein [Niallia sp. 03133]|uniref:YitT family protein n=1 Tax=Niallia sp. 03133 TaxID=3458060 RepID=UPI00404437D2
MAEKLAVVFIGSMLVGIGVNGFLVPHHLLDGGIIGIGLILHYHYHIPTGMTMILISTPLYLFVWFYNKQYFFYGIFGFITSSFMIDSLSFLRNSFSLSLIPSSIIGGIIIGVGIGTMLRFETSTGGTDLLAQIISNFSSIHVGLIIFFIDGFILVSGINIVGFERLLFSFLTIVFVAIFTTLITGKRNEDQKRS